jgi:hypothetical protein
MAASRADLLAAVLPSHPALDAAIHHVVSGDPASSPPREFHQIWCRKRLLQTTSPI